MELVLSTWEVRVGIGCYGWYNLLKPGEYFQCAGLGGVQSISSFTLFMEVRVELGALWAVSVPEAL